MDNDDYFDWYLTRRLEANALQRPLTPEENARLEVSRWWAIEKIYKQITVLRAQGVDYQSLAAEYRLLARLDEQGPDDWNH